MTPARHRLAVVLGALSLTGELAREKAAAGDARDLMFCGDE
jgi:hypothetical protein